MSSSIDLSKLTHLNHLNRSQKRAFILRDQLKFLDAQHLDTFLDGLSSPEPPRYQLINGKVQPPLTQVELKEEAVRFDLGNVLFRKDKSVRTVHLVVEEGSYEVREYAARPRDDADLYSIPIEQYIAMGIVPLFRTKYEAIEARKRVVNETRRYAYHAISQPKPRVGEGSSLTKLRMSEGMAIGCSIMGNGGRKRGSGEPVPQHPSNKRKRIGLDSIPERIKIETFNIIPDKVKTDLFNSVIKAAFPNFDNLMMASWNLISIYASVGSEDKELHTAICDFVEVLKEFEAYHGMSKAKKEPQEETSREPTVSPNEYVSDLIARRNTGDAQPNRSQVQVLQMSPSGEKNGQDSTSDAQSNGKAKTQHSNAQNASGYLDQQHPKVTSDQKVEVSVRKRPDMRTFVGQIASLVNNAHAGSSYTPLPQDNSQRRSTPNDRDRCYMDEAPGEHSQNTSGSSSTADRPTSSRREHRQIHEDGLGGLSTDKEVDKGQNTAQGVFFGQSKLGAPRQPPNATGTAPVAPMMHIRKDGVGGEKREN